MRAPPVPQAQPCAAGDPGGTDTAPTVADHAALPGAARHERFRELSGKVQGVVAGDPTEVSAGDRSDEAIGTGHLHLGAARAVGRVADLEQEMVVGRGARTLRRMRADMEREGTECAPSGGGELHADALAAPPPQGHPVVTRRGVLVRVREGLGGGVRVGRHRAGEREDGDVTVDGAPRSGEMGQAEAGDRRVRIVVPGTGRHLAMRRGVRAELDHAQRNRGTRVLAHVARCDASDPGPGLRVNQRGRTARGRTGRETDG